MAPNYPKLKTNLRLAMNRLKLLEKKKTELALKARKEIADYISAGKDERARIRVEHIIREDYLVEGMELLEMYCDLILARMGLIQQMKTVDEGLQEAITSILWASPRLQADVAELRVISEQFGAKYGKPFVLASVDDSLGSVSPKLKHKLGVQAPPKLLVERYMIEIARSHNIPFEPDEHVMVDDEIYQGELIDFGGGGPGGGPGGPGGGPGGPGGGPGGPGGGGGMALPTVPTQMPQPNPNWQPKPFNYPAQQPPHMAPQGGYPQQGGSPYPPGGSPYPPGGSPYPPGGSPYPPGGSPYPPGGSPYPPQGGLPEKPPLQTPPPPPSHPPVVSAPHPSPPDAANNYSYNEPPSYNTATKDDDMLGLPDLPAVPGNSLPKNVPDPGAASAGGNDLDFDDLTRRFEELKKRK